MLKKKVSKNQCFLFCFKFLPLESQGVWAAAGAPSWRRRALGPGPSPSFCGEESSACALTHFRVITPRTVLLGGEKNLTTCLGQPLRLQSKKWNLREQISFPRFRSRSRWKPRQEPRPVPFTPHPMPSLLSRPFPEPVAFIAFELHILPRHLKIFHESVSLLSHGSRL